MVGHVIVACRTLVPGDGKQRWGGPERRRTQDLWHHSREPRVSGRHRAVVHVVAQVGRDERVVGGRAHPREVRGQARERHHMALAPGRVVEDVPVVEERHVPGRVERGVRRGESRRRDALCIGLPGQAGSLEAVGDVGRRDGVPGGRRAEVVDDTLVRTARESDVVGQAGVKQRRVARGQGVLVCQPVDERRLRIADDLARGVVLHQDDEDVRGVGRARRGGRGVPGTVNERPRRPLAPRDGCPALRPQAAATKGEQRQCDGEQQRGDRRRAARRLSWPS